MLPKQYRISSKDMHLVLQRGRFVRFKGLKLLALPLSVNAFPRLGFMVSMRIEKKAVMRHKIKRCLRQAAMSILHEFLPSYGYVIVVEQKIVFPSTKMLIPILKQTVVLLNMPKI